MLFQGTLDCKRFTCKNVYMLPGWCMHLIFMPQAGLWVHETGQQHWADRDFYQKDVIIIVIVVISVDIIVITLLSLTKVY